MDLTPETESFVQRDVNLPKDYDPSLKGFGGWLLVLIVLRCIALYTSANNIPFPRFCKPSAVMTAGIIAHVVLNILFPILILFFMFKRKIVFRSLSVINASLILAFNIFNVIFFSYLEDIFNTLYSGVSIIIGAGLIIYLYKSKRVKNTFIYPMLYPHVS